MEEEEVKQVVEEIEGEVDDVSVLSGGATHHMFSVSLSDGDEFVFQGVGSRWHDFPAFESGYRIEPEVLNYLSSQNYLSPELRFRDFSKEDSEYRYIGMEKVPGRDMNNVEDKGLFLDLVEQAGEELRNLQELRSFDEGGKLAALESGELEVRAFDWAEMYKSLLFTYTTHMIDRRYDRLREEIERIVEENIEEIDVRNFSIVHQEFGPRNIMFQEDSVTGIIDWERAIAGDPVFDQVQTRERMIQKAEGLEIENPREKVERALEQGYGENIYSDVPETKEALYQLAYIGQLMWVAREKGPQLGLENKFEKLKQKLT